MNTSVVYMCDQRFSIHILIEICPSQEKHPQMRICIILHLILHPKQDFYGNMFGETEEFEKCPKVPP